MKNKYIACCAARGMYSEHLVYIFSFCSVQSFDWLSWSCS